MIETIIRKALTMWHDKDDSRHPGFHASSAGMCEKRVILEACYPEYKKPLTDATKNVFHIGHSIHKTMDDVLRYYSEKTGEILWIQPWLLQSFTSEIRGILNNHPIDEEYPFDRVFGTPDGILIHVDTGTLIIPDFKSSKLGAMRFKKKGYKSRTNELQLGTYIPAIMAKLRSLGITMNISEAVIVYISKDDYDLCIHSYDANLAVQAAKEYWMNLTGTYVDFMKSGGTIFPPVMPPEKWMCDYCSMFKNKTECQRVTDLQTLKNLNTAQEGMF